MDKIEKIIQSGAQINSTLDLNELFILVMNTAAELVDAEAGSVLLLDPKTNELVFKVVTGLKTLELSEFRMDANTGVVGWVVRENKPALVNDTQADKRFNGLVDAQNDFITRSILAVPLVSKGNIIGALEAVNKRNQTGFTGDDLKTLSTFARFVVIAIENAKIFAELKGKAHTLEQELNRQYEFIGQSSQSRETLALIKRVAPTDATVLISGESGTGKEVVARNIHFESNRNDKPFIKVSCAAIPDNLLESEFFGHEKGAFTGATAQRIGRFELAHEGTIFLDEVGELPLNLQAKLLRVIQEMEFERVGGSKTLKVDVRVIAASNKDLKKATEQSEFRDDLYYRLNVVPVNLAPLRERKDDILLLADYFLERLSRKFGIATPVLSREAKDLLMKYHWPGNVRELENTLERVVILGREDIISIKFFPAEMQDVPDKRDSITISENATLPSIEKNIIIQTLKKNRGNQTKTAKALGITRDRLRYRIEKFEIEPSDYK
ncbi:sigma 54-interacting transcriptional regulator [bacterium]|nr:sigma 54-interacting transcriptional regulator [bacterium]